MFTGRKDKAPERLGTEACSAFHLEGKKFLHQKQRELGGESKEDKEEGKSDGFQTRVSLANEA